jgi:hypothetical protein
LMDYEITESSAELWGSLRAKLSILIVDPKEMRLWTIRKLSQQDDSDVADDERKDDIKIGWGILDSSSWERIPLKHLVSIVNVVLWFLISHSWIIWRLWIKSYFNESWRVDVRSHLGFCFFTLKIIRRQFHTGIRSHCCDLIKVIHFRETSIGTKTRNRFSGSGVTEIDMEVRTVWEFGDQT